MSKEAPENTLEKGSSPKPNKAQKLPFYKRILSFGKSLFKKENFEPRIVLKWGVLLGVNLIVPWGLALGLEYNTLADTLAIAFGVLGIFLVLVRIDYSWKIQGKTLQRQALTIGAMLKAIGQFVFIIDIIVGAIAAAIGLLIGEISRPLAAWFITCLVGAVNIGLCYLGGRMVLGIYRSLPIIGERIAVKEEAAALREELRQSLVPPPTFVSERSELSRQFNMFMNEFFRASMPVQERIIQLISETLTLAPPIFPTITLEQLRHHLLDVASSQAVDTVIRVKAIRALGSLKDASFLLKALIAQLDTENGVLHKPLYTAIKQLGLSVRHVVFGKAIAEGKKFSRKNTLFNFDFSDFSSPMPGLKTIVIDTKSCDLPQLESFADYLSAYLDDELLQRQVRVRISDEQRLVPLEFWSAFSQCREVDVYIGRIEKVVYGTRDWEFDEASSLFNPEVASLTLPMSRLQELHIHAPTAELRHLEKFCTYAVNYVGQRHLKRQVDVHVYGNQDELRTNMRNTLEHLCKSVHFHHE